MRRKPFLSINHPFVAVARGGAQKLSRVCAGLWLCHRVARGDFGVEQWLQVLGLLLWGTKFCEDFGIARVRCLTTKDAGPKTTSAEDFIHQS